MLKRDRAWKRGVGGDDYGLALISSQWRWRCGRAEAAGVAYHTLSLLLALIYNSIYRQIYTKDPTRVARYSSHSDLPGPSACDCGRDTSDDVLLEPYTLAPSGLRFGRQVALLTLSTVDHRSHLATRTQRKTRK